MQKIRILFVDCQRLVWTGLRLILEAEPDLEVVGEARDSRTLFIRAAGTSPDVILIELAALGIDAVKVIEQIRRQFPRILVLVISSHADVASVRTILAAGSSGYITTRAEACDLLTAIRSAAESPPFVDPTVASILLTDFLGQLAPGPQCDTGKAANILSQREREVLVRLAQGYTQRQTAEQLCLSVKSVETYRARIAQKLALHSRADLIRYAHASGLLTPEMLHRGD